MKNILSIILLLTFLNLNTFAKNSSNLVVDELEAYIQKGVVVIDIRDASAWKRTGIIPKSYRLTYNNKSSKNKINNDKKWLYTLIRLIKEKNRTFVLISKDGKKAKSLVQRLIKEKKLINAKYLEGGIKDWIDADRKVVNY